MKTSTKPLAFQDIMPVFKTVASQAEFNNMSEREQRRYLRLLDIYRTNLSALKYSRAEGRAEGLQEGLQKGRAEGLQQGMQKGKLEERYKNAKAFKENGVPVALIASTLGLSIEEVEKL